MIIVLSVLYPVDTHILGPPNHVAVALEDSVLLPELMTYCLEQAGKYEAEL